MTTQHCTM